MTEEKDEATALKAELAKAQNLIQRQSLLIKQLSDQVDGQSITNRATKTEKVSRLINVRWTVDPMDEMMHILAKLAPNIGIILDVPESSFFRREAPGEPFPHVRVVGASEPGLPSSEGWYTWRVFEKVEDDDPRLLVPWSDPQEYEFAFDFIYKTPQEAREGLVALGAEDEASEDGWILCYMTLQPVERKRPDEPNDE